MIGYSLLSRLGVLAGTAAIILLNTRMLGAAGQGEIAVFQLGMLLISAVSGYFAGGTVVFLSRTWPLSTLWRAGTVWMAFSALAVGALLWAVGGFPLLSLLVLAGWMQAAIVFHGQILLALHAIRPHNRLAVLQTTLLAAFLGWMYAIGWRTVETYVVSLLTALGLTLTYAGLVVRGRMGRGALRGGWDMWRDLWRFGRSAQTGALLQLLTNRLPFTWLGRTSGAAVAGVYSVAFYGMEAMWTAARAWAPVVHARIAATEDRGERLAVTRGLLVLTVAFTGALWGIAVALPEPVYAWAFGIDGIRRVLVVLGPAVLAGAAASLVAHHLSGIGQHRWNARTSGAALVAVVVCGAWWYAAHGAVGAAAAASVAGLVQISGLLFALHREEHLRSADWLPRRSDWAHLRANRPSTPTTRSDSNPSA